MKILYTDEANIREGQGTNKYGVSIYGGMVLSDSSLMDLTQFTLDLKKRYQIPDYVELKWGFHDVWNEMKSIKYIPQSYTADTPPGIYDQLKQDYDLLKSEVLNKISSSDINIIIVIRPNKLLSAVRDQEIKYPLSSICEKFEKILEKEKETGIILADEIQELAKEKYRYIIDLCVKGSGRMKLGRVVSIVPNMISNLSPIHQLNDIILGALQYYVLQLIRLAEGQPSNKAVAQSLVKIIANKFYITRGQGGARYTINTGILLYPPRYRRRNSPAGKFMTYLEENLNSDFNII